jgi:hypothetical protein
MEPSNQIRLAMARVTALRELAQGTPGLAQAVTTIKHVQAKRFSGTYPDLLTSPVYSGSANFFLEELYSARDYTERDTQFARIAGAIELTFPAAVVATTVRLAQLHCLTEELDLEMARCWTTNLEKDSAARYLSCWRTIGRHEDRNWQLATVLNIGYSLGKLTRKRSLRMLLKMMRKPAELAGLGSLQAFLESGFDRFSGITLNGGTVDWFLLTVNERESNWIERLFSEDSSACHRQLALTIGE